MNKFVLKSAALFLFFATFLFIVVWHTQNKNPNENLVGNYVFYDTSVIDKISITIEEKEFAFAKHDNIWVNADGYYVDNVKIDDFLFALKNSLYTAKALESTTFGYNMTSKPFSTNIKLFSGRAELKEFGYLYDVAEEKDYVMVDGHVYEISQHFNLPQKAEYCFVQPLLPFADDEIEDIYGYNQNFSFADLIFYQAVRKDKLELAEPRSFQIILKNGIVINSYIYKNSDDKYWLEVALSKTILPTKSASEFLKYNSSLYSGWVFLLTSQEGAVIYNNTAE